MLLVAHLAIFWGIDWVTKDYTPEEKEEVWKHLNDGFINYEK